jgi:hypothetical protein
MISPLMKMPAYGWRGGDYTPIGMAWVALFPAQTAAFLLLIRKAADYC